MNEKNSDIKEKAKRRLKHDFFLIEQNQIQYSSEKLYVQALKESQEAYNEVVKATDKIEELESLFDRANDNEQEQIKDHIETTLLLIDICIAAPGASYRRSLASGIANQFLQKFDKYRPLTRNNDPDQGFRADNDEFESVLNDRPETSRNHEAVRNNVSGERWEEDELRERLEEVSKIVEKDNNSLFKPRNAQERTITLREFEALFKLPSFANLDENEKLKRLTTILEEQNFTGQWHIDRLPKFIDKSLLIASLVVPLWNIVDAQEKDRVETIAREVSVYAASYGATYGAAILANLALAPETAGASVAVFLISAIVGAITGESVAVLFDGLFSSRYPEALTKELTKPLDKNLVKNLSKKLEKKLQKLI